MPNHIPPFRRKQVKERERGLCFRCSAPGSEIHHRRSRRVKDRHTHCACNLVLLCHSCHHWITTNPFLASPTGWMVSTYVPDPCSIPVVAHGEPWMLGCEGGMEKLDVKTGT